MRPGTKTIIGVALSGAVLALLYEYVLNPILVEPMEKKVKEVIEQ